MNRRELLIESCEDRILCDATADVPKQDPAVAHPAETMQTAPEVTAPSGDHSGTSAKPAPTPDATAPTGDLPAASPQPKAAPPTSEAPVNADASTISGAASAPAAGSAAQPAAITGREIVFVDTGVENYQQLVADIQAQADDGRHFEVVLLDASRDGVAQISEVLAGREDIAAIHLVTHGIDRAVKLGATWIDRGAFEQRRDEIAGWGAALSSDADVLFYGCDLAASQAGRDLLASFSSVAGADILASTNETGSMTLHGDWALEFQIGNATTGIAFTSTLQQSWSGLLAPFVVTTTANTGVGSLRQAIIDANALAGADTISFAIPAAGVQVINITTALPTITDVVTINGYSQTGSVQNSLAVGTNAVLNIQLDGNGNNYAGLTLGAGSAGSTIRGLSIVNFDAGTAVGILVQSNNNTIAGNYLGIRADGVTADKNRNDNILITGANGNTIGGVSPADRNVISTAGNNSDGVHLVNADSNIIRGNYIGTDASGTLDRGNTGDGIDIDTGSDSNQIIGNLISGNNEEGIDIGDTAPDSTNNIIRGNLIGTQANGTSALGNSGAGIIAGNGSVATGTAIGGIGVGDGNTIAFNGGDGIFVVAGTGVSILGNSIYSNTGLGIDLGANNVTNNDPGDVDTGANNLMNFPVIYSVEISGGNVTITGEARPGAVVEFFKALPDASNGEGQTFLGRGTVTGLTAGTTDATARQFSFTFAAGSVVAGDFVTATATDGTNSTSEFSVNRAAVNGVRIDDVSNILGEGAANGTLAYDLQDYFTGTDTDGAGHALTYSIIGGNTGGAFTINGATGAITVANSAALVWATTPVFNLTVQASDGSITDTATVNINLVARPIDNSTGSFAAAQGNRLYSVNIATGKATLLFTDTALTTINSLGFDAVNGIYYYADGANASTSLRGWDARANVGFVIAADVQTFGVTLPGAGLGAAGGGFGGGSYFFSTEGGGPGNEDQLYKVNFLAGSSGRTIDNIQLISNTAIPGGNEFGDFLVDPAAGKFYSFNSGTGVVEYNLRLGATPSLTVVQTDANAVTLQAARDRNGQMYAVDNYFRTYNPAGAGTFGAQITMTTNGVTALGSVFDAGEYLPAVSSIGDRVWYDTTANGVQDGGEEGIVGLTVSLYYDLNANGVKDAGDTLVATTLTGANGAYSFNQLLPDTYLIEITDPTSILNGAASTTPGGNIQAVSVAQIGQAITINDFGYQDNRPAVAVNNVSATEGPAAYAQFTVSLSRTYSQALTVNLALAAGSALGSGTDYGTGGADNLQVFNGVTWVNATSATFAAGTTTVQVRTPITDDPIDEPNETFTLTATRTTTAISNVSATGTGTIVDNDPAPVVTISNGTAAEGDPLVFDVTLSNPSSGAIVLNLTTTSGTALGGTDYETGNFEYSTDGGGTWLPAASGTQVTIPAGATAIKVRIDSTEDTLNENDETFTLSVASVVSGTVGSTADTGLGTITNDDPVPTVSINDVSVNEAAGTMMFTVSLNTASGRTVTVDYASASGTALSGTDFTAVSGTLTFLAGETSKTFTVPIANDLTDEPDETLNITLTNPSNVTIADGSGLGTIVDNDPAPVVTISNGTAAEGDPLVFDVTLSNPSSGAIVLNLTTTSGTALGGTDYETGNFEYSTDGGGTWLPAASGTQVTIPAGATAIKVRIDSTEDTLNENDETFTLSVASVVSGTVGSTADTGLGTITNDDPVPNITVNDVTRNEAAGTMTFTVSLNTASGLPVSVNYATSNGTATAGNDYTATSGTLNFAAGETSKTVVVTILNDAVFENSEAFNLDLSGAVNATILDAQGVGTILDDGTGPGGTNDDRPAFSINDVTVNEGAGTATFTVTRTGDTNLASTVDYATAAGTAGAADFTGAAGTLNFAAGVGAVTLTVPITIANDTVFELSEQYFVNLSNATNAVISDAQGVGTILDDGTGPGGTNDDRPAFSINDVTVNEGAGTATFTVTRTGDTNLASTVDYATGTGTAGAADFTGATGTLNFAAGVGAVTLTVPITIANDTVFELSEQYFVNLSNATNAVISDAQGVGTILDDGTGPGGTNDDRPAFSINDVTVNEGAGTATFTVTRTGDTNLASTVDYATATGTAGAADFTGAAGTLNFAAGVGAVTLTVPITIANDTVFELSEQFVVNLTNATNAVISDAQGVGTILDDGTGPGGTNDDRPVLSVSSPTVTEGVDPQAVFTVSLSNLSTTDVSVSLALVNGTALGAGSDYGTGGAGNLQVFNGVTWVDAASATIVAGQSSVLVRTPIADDLLAEATETFTLTATRTAGTTLNASAVGTATIADNDGAPNVTINDVTRNEAAGTITFTVSLSAPSALVATVDYAAANGTATGADYAAGADPLSGTLSFAAGVTSQTITLSISNDTVFELSESFAINLSNAVNATILDAQGIGTILDDGTGPGGTNDDRPAFSINDVTVNEGAGTATFTVTRTGDTNLASTVDYATAAGTAGAADFTGATGTLNFAAGVGAVTLTVPVTIANDTVFELSEQFVVNLSNATNAVISDAQGVGTILDDGTGPGGTNDDRPAFSINDVTVNEGAGTATFTVTRTGDTNLASTVDYATATGTAGAADFTGATGTLNFAAGVGAVTVTLPITIANDTVFEGSEQYFVNLTNATNAVISDAQGVGTILDDGTGPGGTNDDRPVLSVSSPTVTEGVDPQAVFTVSLSNLSTSDVSVSLALANGSALGAGSDYGTGGAGNLQVFNGSIWVDAASATIAAGSTSVLVRTPIADDLLAEATETFTLTATRTAGTTLNASAVGTGTIADNDGAPNVTINDVTRNEAAGTITFTVSLSAPSALVATVDYAAANGTATGVDYAAGVDALSGTLSFAAGVTSQTITLAISDDTVFELSESFAINLSNAVNATILDAQGVGTILDDGTGPGGTNDDRPAFSINDVTVNEGAGTATFTVTRTGDTNLASTVDYATATGTAGAADFTGATGTLNFAAGVGAVTVTLPITIANDTVFEGSEQYFVNLTNATNAVISDAQGVGTILDDGTGPGGTNDDRPAFSINDVTVNEGAGTATFTVTRTGDTNLASTVDYATAAGTAGAADFTGATGTLNFAAGVGAVTVTLPITIANDTVFEGSEQYFVNLTNATNAVISDAQGVGTILDDGTGPGGTNDDRPVLSVSSPTVTEGVDPQAVFTVSLSNLSTSDVSVSLALANGSALGAGSDYGTGGAGNLQVFNGSIWVDAASATIAAGSTSVLVRTPIADDLLAEATETFTLTATRTAGTTLNASAVGTGTIADNDGAPNVTINDVTRNEAAGTITFTVSLSAPSALVATVDYAAANGTATGVDYAAGVDALSGTLSFAAGVTSQTITLAISDDTVFELSESFAINLTNAVNAVILDAQGVGTILDDGTGPGGTNDDRPAFSINDVTVNEGAGTATFTVTRTGDTNLASTVDYATATGTAGAADFTGATGTLNFAAGVGAVTLTVPITIANDTVFEGSEQYFVNLTNATNAIISDAQGVGTILDDGTGPGGTNDDRPAFSINDVTVNEGAGTATFTVTRTGDTNLASTVDYATATGTAGAADFTGATGTLNFAAGVGAVTLTVPITIANDTVFELSEQFVVNLSNATNAVISDAQGVGTILDDGTGPGGTNDDRPAFSINDVTVNEGAGTATFTVTRTGDTNLASTVDYATATGTAGAADFTGATGTLNFAAGVGAVTLTVPITIANDTVFEGSEQFVVNLSNATNAVILDAQGVGTILDDGTGPGGTNDDRPAFSINDVTVNEGAGTATFTVTRTGDTNLASTVDYATATGTAGAADFTGATGTLNFAAGVGAVTLTVPVSILNDAVFEGSETFVVNLSNATNAVISDAQGVGTILDDGTGPGGTNDDRPAFSINDVTVNEGAGTATFTVTRTGDTNLASTVDYATATGTAGAADFTGATGTLNFAAGVGAVTLTVPITIANDTVFEGSEQYFVNLTNATNAIISDAQGVGTILDDGTGPGGTNDDRPAFSINDVTVNEGAGTATFTVTRTGDTNLASTVDYATATGTAGAADFTGATGTLNFAAGVGAVTLTVPITIANDTVFELSEQFVVNLSNATNAVISDAQGVGTILDDGTGPGGTNDDRPAFSINDVTVNEGAGTATFTVTRTGDTNLASTVDYATATGTAGAADFTGATGTLNFAAGVGAVTLTVPITIANDTVFEGSEQFVVNLSNATNAVILDAQGVGTILDDGTGPGGTNDDRPAFSINDVTVNEGAGTATFTVTRTGDTNLASTVDYATATGTAGAADFTGATGTLNFAAGVGAVTLTVPVSILNDAVFEGSETFVVNLSNATNAVISDAQGVGTILDDGTGPGGTNDDRPAFSINDVTVNEGAGTATFTVTRTGDTNLASTVDYATAAGTAGAADFTGATGTLNFAAGVGAVTVTLPITIANDTVFEGSEQYFVNLSNATNAVISDAQGVGTILDDGTGPGGTNDDRPAFSINDVTVNEGAGTATFTVTRTGDTNLASTVDYATAAGTAGAADFTGATGTLNFAAGVGAMTVTLPITIANDTVFELSEQFVVNLSNATNAVISDAQGVGTILDDGTGPGGTNDDRPAFSINDVTVNEGAGTATFTVTRTGDTNLASTVDYATATGTAGAADFTGATGTLNFAAGVGAVTVTLPITIANDTVFEGSEQYFVNLTNATNAVISDAQGVGTILDDGTGPGGTNDDRPAFSINDVTVNEGAGTATFTVTRTGDTNLASTVDYATATGTAGAADFTGATGTLNFAAGVGAVTVTLPITIANDTVFEGSEQYFVNLTNATNAVISDAQGVGTILDDGTGPGGTNDDRPVLSVSSPTVTEGVDPHAVFTVSLSNLSTSDVSVSLALASGSALGGGSDYGTGGAGNLQVFNGSIWVDAASATIAAGSTSVLVRTPIADDLLAEATETFTLTATRTAGTTLNASAVGTGTIADNDGAPNVTINDVTRNEAAGTITFTVSLSAPSALVATVDYAAANGTATGVDYAAGVDALSGTLSFAAGVTSQTITLAISDDTVFELSESFAINLSNAVNATILDAQGVGTILDDGTGPGGTNDDRPAFSINDVTVNEGAGTATFTVTRTGDTNLASTVDYATATGTAGAADFTGATGTLNFVAGVGAVTLTVPITIANDTVFELSEQFVVNLSNAVNAVISDAQGVGTILDDGTGPGGTNDDRPAFSINDVTVNEGAGTATFTVTRTGDTNLASTVDYATATGTAGAADFTGATGTLNFAAGVGAVTLTVPITIANDTVFEGSEQYFVNLTNATNAIISDAQGVGTILDDGTGPGGTNDDRPAFSINDVTVNEGAGTATFTVTRTGDTNLASTVDYATATGTAGAADFTGATGTLNFAAGVGAVTLTVPITIANDTVFELSEQFVVNLSNATNAVISDAQGVGTILDDGTGPGGTNDDRPAFSINDVTVNEGAGTATFTVTRTGDTNLASTVDYATATGTAGAADFTGATGTLNFAAGVGAVTLTVPITIANDTVFEGSEQFVVNLSNATNAVILDAQGVGTILDDGTGPGGTNDDRPAFSINDVTVNEGAGTATFTVTRTGDTNLASTVDYATATGTAGAADFTGATGTLNFAAGVGAVTLTVPVSILNDAVFEGSETFVVNLSNATNAVISDAQGVGTILDDGTGPGGTNDDRPAFSINDVTVNEGAGTATFTVTRTGDTNLASTVDYATATGTAGAADFTGATGTLNFAAGVGAVTLTVPITIANDTVFEGSEQYFVNLTNATNAIISDAQGVGTILDDGTGPGGTNDDRPAFSINDVTVNEGAGTATFTVTRTGDTNLASTVDYATATGTAGAADFTGATGTLNFAAGVGAVTLTVPITIANDTVFELSEQFVVNLSNATNAVISDAQGVGTILDDGTGPGGTNDDRPAFSINDVTVNEGAGTATFTVTRTGDTNLASTVDYATATGTAGAADFTGATGTLNFAAGVGAVTLTVPITIANDTVFEGSEQYFVNLTNATNAVISDAQGVGTILDDGTGPGGTNDDRPVLSVSSPTVTEGVDPQAVFTVSLSNLSTTDVSFSLALANGTALGAGSDYGTGGAGNLQVFNGVTWVDAASATIVAGSTSVLVRTPIADDLLAEATETFTLTATRTAGTTVNASAVGTGTIVDTDGPPVVVPPPAPTPQPPPAPSTPPPAPAPFVFAFDSFNNFSTTEVAPGVTGPWLPPILPIDTTRPALLPLAPIYSGEADPGATLVIELYNASGVRIATQVVLADAGGNWLANFGGAELRDAPTDVRITQTGAPYAFGAGAGHNLRTYYAPAALNPGHFLAQSSSNGLDDGPAPLLGGLGLSNPLQLGASKYGDEFLTTEGVASGE